MSDVVSFEHPVVVTAEDDRGIRETLRAIYTADGYDFLLGVSVTSTFEAIDRLAAAQAAHPEQAAALGRFVLHLDGSFPGSDDVSPATHPQLFSDPVVQRNYDTDRTSVRAAVLVARYAIQRLGINSLGFILVSANAQPFELPDVLTREEAEGERAAVWIIPKPFEVDVLMDAAAAINQGDTGSYIATSKKPRPINLANLNW